MLAESHAIVIIRLIVVIVIIRVELWHSGSLSDELMCRVVYRLPEKSAWLGILGPFMIMLSELTYFLRCSCFVP